MKNKPMYQIKTFDETGAESFDEIPTDDFSSAIGMLVDRFGLDADYQIGRDKLGQANLVVTKEGQIKATVAVYFPPLKLAA